MTLGGAGKAIYRLRLALRAARRTCGLKADLYYIIASLTHKPVSLSIAGLRATVRRNYVGRLVMMLASAARCPYINGGYLDIEMNYFGRRYVVGLPLEYVVKYGRPHLADDAIPPLSTRDCKPMSPRCPYYVGDLTGAEVLDVGGYTGDTALYFYGLGARHVKVYEPFFYEIARRNLRVNGLPEDVEPYAVGDGSRACVDAYDLYMWGGVGAKPSDASSLPTICADGRTWQEALDRDYDLVKADCEGCERHLLNVPCDYIRRSRRWVLEVHDNAVPGLFGSLVGKFQSCGFSVSSLVRGSGLYTLYAL